MYETYAPNNISGKGLALLKEPGVPGKKRRWTGQRRKAGWKVKTGPNPLAFHYFSMRSRLREG